MTKAVPIRLDIFADPVCPWCLIGKAELDRALAARPDHPFAITWHPFRLNPALPPEGVPMDDYLRAKLGARAPEILGDLARRAEGLGITLNPPAREPNTTDAHRLMHWAGIEGVGAEGTSIEGAQSRVMQGLLAAHWREGRDISDAAVLAGIGADAGLDGTMIRRLLATDADRAAVNAAETHARERGVNAVPTFIIADHHVVGGAQPAQLWQQVIDELTGEAG